MRTTVLGVRTFVLMLCVSLSAATAFSQSITTGNGKYEIGFGIGPLFFLGDLGGNYGTGKTFIKDVNLPLTKVSKGFYAAVYPSEFIGFRAAINHGQVEGYDHMVEDKGGAEYFRKKRNLQFRSSVLEAYVAAEIYPTVFLEQYDGLAGKLRPYGIVGFGAFKFNPKGEYIDASGRSTWVPLKPLHLEGQGMDEYPNRKEYSLVATEIPMGFGAKYYIKDNMYIGMEVLHRKTFTDYMDDVSTDYIDGNLFDQYLSSADAQMAKQLFYRENRIGTTTRPFFPPDGEQRGDPKENDSFFSTIIKFGWRLNDWNSPNGRAARQLRCPAFY
jgi:hypothetical protein